MCDRGCLPLVRAAAGQVGYPLLVAALPLVCLGLQASLDLPQPSQPAGRAGQLGWEFVALGGAMLAVLGLVGGGRLPQQLCDLVLELGQGSVGPIGGVRLDLGAVQRDHAQADQTGRGAQPQGLDQEVGQRLLVPDAEPGDGHMVGDLVPGQDPEGNILDAAPLDLPRRAHPDAVGIQQHTQQQPGS
jgi:hypothetical protein